MKDIPASLRFVIRMVIVALIARVLNGALISRNLTDTQAWSSFSTWVLPLGLGIIFATAQLYYDLKRS